MLPVGAVVVDFDGTACAHDVAEHLLAAFAEEDWASYDEAVDRREIGLWEAIQVQDRMLLADRETMTGFALQHCQMDPTFAPFCAWLASEGVPVSIASDGFGFYIGPLLEREGLGHLPVITNRQRWGADARPEGIDFVSSHAVCVGCGTCKMQAVERARARNGAVAFIGEGPSDRYGAFYADIVFAKDALPAYCDADGVPYLRWETFDDVRRALEDPATHVPGPVAPLTCPGWTLPPE